MIATISEVVAKFPALQALNPVPLTRNHLTTALACGVLSEADALESIKMVWPSGGEIAQSAEEFAALMQNIAERIIENGRGKTAAEIYKEIMDAGAAINAGWGNSRARRPLKDVSA